MGSKPTALGVNFDSVEEKIRRYTQELIKDLQLEEVRFYACEPWDHVVENHDGDRWLEAWFCLEVKGIVSSCRVHCHHTRKTINIFGVESNYNDNTCILLSARILE